MNATLQWKLAVGFLLVFLAGATTGGFFVANHTRHLRADFAHPHHWLAERMSTRMQRDLDLTSDQLKKTAPIFEKAASELEKIRAETGERVQQIIAEANRALLPELSEAQRAKLEALENQPRPGRKMHKRAGQRPPR